MKSVVAKGVARFYHLKAEKWKNNPLEAQQKVFQDLIKKGRNTRFGKDHHFQDIETIQEFQKEVPVQSYEDLLPYITQIQKGEKNILWLDRPEYFAKTSGTTSGAKYIPITKISLKAQINAARGMLLEYIYRKGNASITKGKAIFLQGSPELEEVGGIPTGRLSGIVAHTVPVYLQKNRLPSWETNSIDDWETKVDAIVEETKNEDLRLISGIPPWLIMYFERLIIRTSKKNIGEIFPNLQLIVTGGVNYEPYRQQMNELIDKEVDILQTFPASEGFFAYQDTDQEEGLLLLVDGGIFYEFIPLNEYGTKNAKRLTLSEVELDKDYAMIISTNAGLWAYDIGDTVRFVSNAPYRLKVSGRVKHFTSAFGEHVIAHEVEEALKKTLENEPAEIVEFTLAPQVNPEQGLPYHEWLIEFSQSPADWDRFSSLLDKNMRSMNPYYDDLVKGKVLQPLVVTPLKRNSFINYMKSKGKLGGQNKVPRLSNDRNIADELYHQSAPKKEN